MKKSDNVTNTGAIIAVILVFAIEFFYVLSVVYGGDGRNETQNVLWLIIAAAPVIIVIVVVKELVRYRK